MDKAEVALLNDAIDEGVEMFKAMKADGIDADYVTDLMAKELADQFEGQFGPGQPRRIGLFVAVAIRRLAGV